MAASASATPWFARVWQVDDGLPGDNVTGVTQTPDGYLWVATQTGLARFDGISFDSYSIPIGRPHPIIRAMMQDNHDRLWLAEEGGAVVRMLDGAPEMYTTNNGLSRNQPLELAADGEGGIWIANADGAVSRILDGKVTRFGEAEGLPVGGTCCLTCDSQNQIWFAKAGQVGVFKDGKFVTLQNFTERTVHLQAKSGGGVWVCAGDRLMSYQAGGTNVDLATIPPDTTAVRPTVLYEAHDHALWIGTFAGGLFRYDTNGVARVETSHRRIRTITEDREGNIWVGTDGGGLNRLRQQVVEIQGKDAGLPFDTVRSACEDADGAFWVVTQNGEVVNNRSGSWNNVSSTPNWTGGQATCVTCDKNGNLWVGTFSHGLYRRQGDNFIPLRRANGLSQTSIRSLFADSRGDLWIAFSTGDVLQRLRAGQFKNYELPADGRAIRAFAEDSKGNIWMANLDMRLLRVDATSEDGKVVDETEKTEEPYHPIRSLAATPDGALWIGYSASGIGRLKNGKFVKIGLEQGLRDDSICSMVADNEGSMWFGSDHGIFRANLDQLLEVQGEENDFVKCFGYGRDEGLPSLQGYYGYAPGASLTRDGRVLIPTHSGLAVVHPRRVRTNVRPPPVLIEKIELDGRELTPGKAGVQSNLPPGHRKLEFTFTAPSFVEPEKVRFRYWLEGWDPDWTEAENLRYAAYSRLPAGQYRFHVTAGNSDGIWNEAGTEFVFKVAPFFWQTWWFRVLVVGVFSVTIFAVARFVSERRLRNRVRRLEQENLLQTERARIAQDIHDDFGARMTQISLLSDLAQSSLTKPETASSHVAQIAGIARQGIKSLDEIVWAVNPRNDNLADLLDYAGQYAVDFLQTAGTRCRLDFPENVPAYKFSGEARHGLFLAVKEALNNVAKHAQATEVWLRVTIADEKLRWVIEDNGTGFEAGPSNPLADGLRNMQARLAAIGGVCSIEGRPGAGARITFEVPLKKGS